MQLKFKNYTNYILLVIILLVLGFLYNRYKDKLDRESSNENYSAIQKYLLNESDLDNVKKPILWIPVYTEYNSRNWLSWGSRSSYDLNQPYQYLTTRSIISQCSESFHVCIIDDESFAKLLPNWKINMKTISSPVLDYMRQLAMAKLLYMYGGIIVPPSFLCMRDLNELYEVAENNNKMFICESVNRNITSTTSEFFPNINFIGAPKNCPVVQELINFMERTISSDYTAQLEFLGEFNRWCEYRVRKHQIILINGKLIGTKTLEDTPILIDDLLSNEYLDLYSEAYGIYIPADEILNRTNYQWFARMSQEQLLESRVIICKYMLIATANVKGTIEPFKKREDWVSFWKVPSGAPVWGLKPDYLGNNLVKLSAPTN